MRSITLAAFCKKRFDKAMQRWQEQRSSTDVKAKTEALLDSTSRQPKNISACGENRNNIRPNYPVHDIIILKLMNRLM